VAALEAQNAVAAARRELQERQQDLRPLEAPDAGAEVDASIAAKDRAEVQKSRSEILKAKVRINYMEAELVKFKKMATGFEEKVKVSKSLTEISDGLEKAENEVQQITAASINWPSDGTLGEEETQRIAEVQGQLSTRTAAAEKRLASAQGLEHKELKAFLARLQKAQWHLNKVKEQARQRGRAAQQKAIKGVAAAVTDAEAQVVRVCRAAFSASSLPAMELQALSKRANAVLELVGKAQTAIISGQQTAPESKVEFARLQLRTKAMDRKMKGTVDSLAERLGLVSAEAMEKALDALRVAAQREDGSHDAEGLFLDLSEGNSEVTESQFSDFFTTRIGTQYELAAEEVELVFHRLAPLGLTRRAFVAALSDILRVVRDCALTDDFQIQSAKKVRKLVAGELLEALAAVSVDGGLGLERVRCRAFRDGATGWATVKTTSGTSYLERGEKPYLWCKQTVAMRKDASEESSTVRELRPGEVLELLEGPREELLASDRRVRGTTCHDEAPGWLQVSDRSGACLAKLSPSVHKCSEAVAMTDIADFASCSMVRRIDAGEALELLGDDEAKPPEGGARRKFRACRDGREGWVTTQGQKGTIYVKAVPRHYICLEASPLHAGLSADSVVVRVLHPGEAFAAFEEPKDVCDGERLTIYRARAAMDGLEGWVLCNGEDGDVQGSWSSKYITLKAVPLTASLVAADATGGVEVEVVRLLEAGEAVDATELPMEDASTGHLRIRCVALRDKAVGWATVQEAGASGPLLMRPAAPEELRGAAGPSTPPASGEVAPVTPPMGSAAYPTGGRRPIEVKQELPDESRSEPARGAQSWSGAHRPKGKGKGKGKEKGKSKVRMY